MYEYGVLTVIFIASMVLAAMVLERHPTIYKPKPLKGENTKTDAFKKILENAPFLAWANAGDGRIWANKAAKNLEAKISDLGTTAFSYPNSIASQGRIGCLTQKNMQQAKFNIFTYKADHIEYGFAFAGQLATEPQKPPDRFLQTMSTTFAHLKIGIAVFNSKNQLSLFNPALSEHLGLRPEWLLKKPNLLGFLDRLRNSHILPEPKDYTSWHNRFRQIKRSAVKDDFQEEWGLPDGRTLRVIGRPHPSGTVVFLFEDVTAVLAMERQFRSRVSCLENALDAASLGLIVFNRKGHILLLNASLKKFLGGKIKLATIQDFSRAMQKIFQPTPIWGDLRAYVEDTQPRSAWQADIEMYSDETVSINFEPISSGNTLCELHLPLKLDDYHLTLPPSTLGYISRR
ncbi:MAG: PAS-domain containing protein [Rhodobacterales bacterium]